MRLAALAFALAAACRTAPPVVPLDTTGAAVAFEAGLAKVGAHDELGAIEDFTRALELDPSNAAAWRWRGHCLNVHHYFEEALADYDKAIELEPTYAWSHYARGMAHNNLKRREVAIRGYTAAIELDPSFWKAWSWRGFTRRILGEYDTAASDLEHALTLAPDDVETLLELAKTRQAQNDLAACGRALERAARVDPTNATVQAHLGHLTAVNGSVAQSIAHFEQACALRHDEEPYARIWIWMQRVDRATADRELRTWFDDSRIDDTWQLQLAAFLLGEGTDELMIARADAVTRERAAAGDPLDYFQCEALFYAALRREHRGEHAAALDLYERASELDAPESWEWHMARVRARSIPR